MPCGHRYSVLALLLTWGCAEPDLPPPLLIGDPAGQVAPPMNPSAPDLRQCSDGPTKTATTSWDELARIDGFEATNTDTDCPRGPAECGAWWAKLVPLNQPVNAEEGELLTVTFASDPVGDLCELHVADTVAGRIIHDRRDDVTNGVIDVWDLCLIDEHGHVATGQIDLFSATGVIHPTRAPCD